MTNHYSVEFRPDGLEKGSALALGQWYGEDGLSISDAHEMISGYLSYSGTTRLFSGWKLIAVYYNERFQLDTK